MRLETIIEYEGMPEGMEAMLSRIGDAATAEEGVSGRYQVALVVTDDAGIRDINREQRGIDRETDVLSFPSATFRTGTAKDNPKRLRQEFDAETGCIHLGDIIISLPRARTQAEEYGHALTREIGYLFAHGMLHLLGYDHEDKIERVQMRAMEDRVMEKTGVSRELSDVDFALVEGAREAMQNAYVPYSHFRVGACIRTTDGKLYKGCNVENASYGMTICAERNAMTTAVTEGMHSIEAIAITGDGPSMPYPCGACRQFMREFAKDMKVIIATDEKTEVTTLGELLPMSFGPESLEGVDA